ncbi:MAG: bile acid:sodium symporter [Brumimicrobium sp.]
MKSKLKIPDTFVVGLLLMVVLAYFFPFKSTYNEAFPLKKIIYWGITGIFFLYGLKINPNKIKEDIGNWKLHLIIQLTTFLLFPLILLLFYPVLKGSSYHILWLASFFLAVLPSTVSSSVVMVSIGKGNVPAAIFNASISGLIGLIMTPFWMSLFMKKAGHDIEILEMMQQLFFQILLPVIIGLLLNRFIGKYIQKHSAKIGWFDKVIIFLIIYKSFSAAFLNGIFTQVPLWTFILLSGLIILLFFVVYGCINLISGLLSFNRADTITALFCGSKKSLVHGSVFVTLIVSDLSTQSLFLLPIMIYHAFQLFYTSYKARRFAKEVH